MSLLSSLYLSISFTDNFSLLARILHVRHALGTQSNPLYLSHRCHPIRNTIITWTPKKPNTTNCICSWTKMTSTLWLKLIFYCYKMPRNLWQCNINQITIFLYAHCTVACTLLSSSCHVGSKSLELHQSESYSCSSLLMGKTSSIVLVCCSVTSWSWSLISSKNCHDSHKTWFPCFLAFLSYRKWRTASRPFDHQNFIG